MILATGGSAMVRAAYSSGTVGHLGGAAGVAHAGVGDGPDDAVHLGLAHLGQAAPDGGIPTDEELEAMPVVQLRVLARSLNVEGMSRREIRDAPPPGSPLPRRGAWE